VTFPSPQLTASTFPARLHETRHTTSGNFPGVAPAPGAALTDGSSAVWTQGAAGVSFVHTSTVLSCRPTASRCQQTSHFVHTPTTERKNRGEDLTCDAVAMYERGSPMFGAQATSRTQSVWPSSTPSSTQACVSSENPQILTMLSHPALANRFTGAARAPPVLDNANSEPARAAGAHDTALHPMAWASNTSAPHWPSSGHFYLSQIRKRRSSPQWG